MYQTMALEIISITRHGLFENLKSKFGADGKLNSGSQGSYRQLVGDFTKDGGPDSAMPGFTTKEYSKNQVTFMDSGDVDSAGYYMALKDVSAGTKIEDTGQLGSNWIKISDKNGRGFAESYPEAQTYNPFSNKKDARGASVAYLAGEVVKAPAHWSNSGSNIFLRANMDIPQGKTMAEIFAEDLVGSGKMFELVGESLLSGRPTTEYIGENKNYQAPSLFSSETFANLLNFHGAPNGYTPGAVRVEGTEEESVQDTNSEIFQVDEISGIRGDMQEKVYLIDNVLGSAGDVFEVTVSGNGFNTKSFNFTATTDDPFDNFSSALETELDTIFLADGSNAFDVSSASGETRVKGQSVGDFTLNITPVDNGALDNAEVSLNIEEEYKADTYSVTVNGVTISVNSKNEFNSNGTQQSTSQALADAINNHSTLKTVVKAELLSEDSISLTGLTAGRKFTTEASSTDVLTGEISINNGAEDKPTEAASLVVNTTTPVSASDSTTSSSSEVVADNYDIYVLMGIGVSRHGMKMQTSMPAI